MKQNVNFFWKSLVVLIFPLVVVASVLFVVSCKITAEGIESLEGDFEVPVLNEFVQVNEKTFELNFSEPVELSEICILKERNLIQNSETISIENNSDCMKTILLEDGSNLEIGQEFCLSGIATDLNGNSLSFSIPFYGFNNNMAGLVLSEIRADMSKTKVEFVELYVYKAGNVGGMLLYSASDDGKDEYVFPAAEVKKGEYIVVHFRSLEEQTAGCVDEISGNLNLSVADDSCTDARDFWLAGSEARIGKSDVILLRERLGGKLMDSVVYAEDSLVSWKNEAFVNAVTEAVEFGVWYGGVEVSAAASSTGITNTRTLSRQNISQIVTAVENNLSMPENNRNCWMITKTSSASPGKENSSEPYVK